MRKLTPKDIQDVRRLRSLFPDTLNIYVRRSKDGGFYAAITSFPGCFTEADTLSELIGMVNDVVYTYFEIPQKYLSYMPSYLLPLEVAKSFGMFPVKKIDQRLMLKNIDRETVKN
jgi:predicted RNase H-like HicB family nuclease